MDIGPSKYYVRCQKYNTVPLTGPLASAVFIGALFVSGRTSGADLCAIVESGSHAELMRIDGLYAELYNLQASTSLNVSATAESRIGA